MKDGEWRQMNFNKWIIQKKQKSNVSNANVTRIIKKDRTNKRTNKKTRLLLHSGFRYLNYLLLLPERRISIDRLSRGGLLSRGRILMSADTWRGVFDLRSMGELSLFDSVLESGQKISAKKRNGIFMILWGVLYGHKIRKWIHLPPRDFVGTR